MSNTTETPVISMATITIKVIQPSSSTVISSWILLVLSVPAMLLNLPLVVGVLRERKLRARKEMLLLSNTAFYAAINGLMNFLYGIVTLSEIVTPPAPGWTPLQCLIHPQVLLVIFSGYGCYTAMILMNVDRLVCVANIVAYMKLSVRYSYAAIGLSLFLACCGSAHRIYVVLMNTQIPFIHPALCPTAAVSLAVNVGSYYVMYSLMCCIVLVYALIIIVLLLKKKSIIPALMKIEIERQKQVTKFLGLMAVVTLFALVAPSSFSLYIQQTGNNFLSAGWSTAISAVKTSHPFLYSLPFWLRQKEDRYAVLCACGIRNILKLNTIVQAPNSDWNSTPNPNKQYGLSSSNNSPSVTHR